MKLTLYSKPGCHLCEEMKAVIATAGTSHAIELEEVDISTSPELLARYGESIPVLVADGRTVAKHRIDERRLTSIISR